MWPKAASSIHRKKPEKNQIENECVIPRKENKEKNWWFNWSFYDYSVDLVVHRFTRFECFTIIISQSDSGQMWANEKF